MPVETPLQSPITILPPEKTSASGTAGTLAIVSLIAASLGLGVTKTTKDGVESLVIVRNDIGSEPPAVQRTGPPRLLLPTSPVEPYTLVRLQVVDPGTIDDVLVMTAIDGVVVFVDIVESKVIGEFAFTGPPGTYSIRIKPQGVPALTGRVVIGRAPQPPPPIDPVAPATPTVTQIPPAITAETTATFSFSSTEPVTFLSRIDNGAFTAAASPQTFAGLAVGSHTFQVKARNASGQESPVASYSWTVTAPLPPPDPIPPGKYGFGPLAYEHASKIPQPARAKAVELANNFETVAAEAVATSMTAQEAINKVSSKNALIYSDPNIAPAWMPFRQAWKDKADALNAAGTLRNLASDYAEAFRETATGLRAIK